MLDWVKLCSNTFDCTIDFTRVRSGALVHPRWQYHHPNISSASVLYLHRLCWLLSYTYCDRVHYETLNRKNSEYRHFDLSSLTQA